MVPVTYLIHYDTLLQNVSDFSLQNTTVSLLQNKLVIFKCDDFITKCNTYYKMWHVLQNALVHLP